jgi:hypothetical protein
VIQMRHCVISFTPDAVGSTYQDTRGTRFSNPEQARAHAELIAAELAPDGGWQGGWLHVVDEKNQEISTNYLTTKVAP